MFITLTNVAADFAGQSITINSDIIATMREEHHPDLPKRTYVFCPPHGTWEVRETPEEIAEMLNR